MTTQCPQAMPGAVPLAGSTISRTLSQRIGMHHDTSLIDIIAVGLAVAFILGTLAQKVKLSPLVGYLLAGVCVGPFTPGFVADQTIANQLSELGVMLLMFGVGLHFSLDDLMEVKWIAVPGALAHWRRSWWPPCSAGRWRGAWAGR
ncbi:Glutathione-regulated potassium-efflux system protein KefB [Xanthomonas euvesicatoria]